MMKLSNKGQSLVLFVIFLPFIIMIMAFVIDYSILNINANKVDSLNKMIIKYGVKNIDNNPKEEMIKLIKLNDNNLTDYKIDIDEENKIVNVTLIKNINSFSYKLIKNKDYKVKSVYKGYIKDKKIVIERSN